MGAAPLRCIVLLTLRKIHGEQTTPQAHPIFIVCIQDTALLVKCARTADGIDGDTQVMLPKVLVIDDAVVHRGILCRTAEKAHFKAIGAASVEEADRWLQDQAFDCITLDLSLGDRAGVEVLRLLSERGIRTPVIVISGSDDAVLKETLGIGKMMGLNIRQPITKPIDLAQLRSELGLIEKHVDLQRLAYETAY